MNTELTDEEIKGLAKHHLNELNKIPLSSTGRVVAMEAIIREIEIRVRKKICKSLTGLTKEEKESFFSMNCL